jgi:hypothetical protein
MALSDSGVENPLTWKHLKERIRRADLPKAEIFCTNGIVGLRSSDGAKALDKRIWQNDASFMDFCREFFEYQMEVLKPRLIVVLGPTAKSTLLSFARITPEVGNTFSDNRKAADAVALRAAWKLHGSG